MPKNECRLLVLSPRARSIEHAREYKPFREKMLSEILDEVATEIAKSTRRDYDRHEVFAGFFFGKPLPGSKLQEALRDGVPTSLVDCELYRSSESAAVEAAKNALFHFAFGAGQGGKGIILVCNDACGLSLDYDAARASNDAALIAHLWCDLSLNKFKRLGKTMSRRRS